MNTFPQTGETIQGRKQINEWKLFMEIRYQLNFICPTMKLHNCHHARRRCSKNGNAADALKSFFLFYYRELLLPMVLVEKGLVKLEWEANFLKGIFEGGTDLWSDMYCMYRVVTNEWTPLTNLTLFRPFS